MNLHSEAEPVKIVAAQASPLVTECTRDPASGTPTLCYPERFPSADDVPPLTDGRAVLEMSGRWFVAATKPRHEKVYAAELWRLSRYTDGAVGFLMPTVQYRVKSGNREWRTFHRPMFPGHIFVCVADETIDLDPNHRTYPGYAIKVIDSSQAKLRDDLSRVERMVLTDPARVEPWPGIRVGVRVRILSGGFMGMTGDVIKLDGDRRKLVVVIETLGQACCCDLDPDVQVELATE